jgi:hypothetical protein
MEQMEMEIPGLVGRKPEPVPMFELPKKPTCTPSEAARATGISERQIRYLIEDGNLLAISANRNPEEAIRPQWRVVVRMDRPRAAGKGKTLQELIETRKSV